jgi:polyhydroxybutyrate depolymerase
VIKNFRQIGLMILLSMPMVFSCGYQSLSKDNPMPPGTYSREIEAAGRRWTYKVHVPSQYRPDQDTPLVLLLHGAGGDGELYLEATGWRKKSNEAGFIVVAPDGLPSRPLLPAQNLINPRVWNAGNLRERSNRVKINDIEFFRKLLNQIKQDYSVDKQRIYVTGHSNGGGMTFMLATELPDFAAIAPVMALYWRSKPSLAAPVSTLYMVGTKDPVIPLDGGASKLSIWGDRSTPPVKQIVDLWARASGCPTSSRIVSSQQDARIAKFYPCSNGTEFLVYLVEGQGHNWPGGSTNLAESIIGPNQTTINATDIIWNFFRLHTR